MSHIKFLRDPDLTRMGVLKNLCGVFMLFILFVTSIILIIGIKHDYFIATNGVQDFAYITNKRSYETQSGKFSISRTNYEIHYTFLDDSQNEINKQTHVDQDFYTQHNIGDKFKIIRIDNRCVFAHKTTLDYVNGFIFSLVLLVTAVGGLIVYTMKIVYFFRPNMQKLKRFNPYSQMI